MKTQLKLLTLLFLLAFSFSCNKTNEEENPIAIEEPQPELVTNVYALVSEYDGANYTINVWKNDVDTPLNLTNTTSVVTESMYVSGAEVYVGGYEHNSSKNVAKIWKNGE